MGCKWGDLKQLKVRNFNWKKEAHPNKSHKHIGFIAQEVETVFPGLVNELNLNSGQKYTADSPEVLDGTKEEGDEKPENLVKSVRQGTLIPILTKALQEAMDRIETLETKVAALEG